LRQKNRGARGKELFKKVRTGIGAKREHASPYHAEDRKRRKREGEGVKIETTASKGGKGKTGRESRCAFKENPPQTMHVGGRLN